jgi:peptidoglycan hydrolase-like protein with peptidoglycan-binding domain
MPAGAFGPAFLGLGNYDAIRSYNVSDVYVLFVVSLADRITGNGAFKGIFKPVVPISARDIEALQTRLAALGLYHGKSDGQAGPLTRAAIGNYQKTRNMQLTCWPDRNVLRYVESDKR